MLYGIVIDGVIGEIGNRPLWKNAEGIDLTDEELLVHNYYRVDGDSLLPKIDVRYQSTATTPKETWEIKDGKIIIGYTIVELSVDDFRDRLKAEVKGKFSEAQYLGYSSEALAVTVNCGEMDILRLTNRYEYMVSNKLTTTPLRLFDNTFKDCTLENLAILVQELKEYNLQLLDKKWGKDVELDNLKTINLLKDFVVW